LLLPRKELPWALAETAPGTSTLMLALPSCRWKTLSYTIYYYLSHHHKQRSTMLQRL
jgi:hypothetical protein